MPAQAREPYITAGWCLVEHPDRIVHQRAVGKIRLVEIDGRIDDRPLAVMALHLLEHDLHVGDGRCHTNLDRRGAAFGRPARLRPRWRLATSGTPRLAGRGACGGM